MSTPFEAAMLEWHCERYQTALDNCDPCSDSHAFIYVASTSADERRGESSPGATTMCARFLEGLRRADRVERDLQARVKGAVLNEFEARRREPVRVHADHPGSRPETTKDRPS